MTAACADRGVMLPALPRSAVAVVSAAVVVSLGAVAVPVTLPGGARAMASPVPAATTSPAVAVVAAPAVAAAPAARKGPAGVDADAGELVDASTGKWLWSRGLNTRHPIASITKVMTALVVVSAGDLSRKIRVTQAAEQYARSQLGRQRGPHRRRRADDAPATGGHAAAVWRRRRLPAGQHLRPRLAGIRAEDERQGPQARDDAGRISRISTACPGRRRQLPIPARAI